MYILSHVMTYSTIAAYGCKHTEGTGVKGSGPTIDIKQCNCIISDISSKSRSAFISE